MQLVIILAAIQIYVVRHRPSGVMLSGVLREYFQNSLLQPHLSKRIRMIYLTYHFLLLMPLPIGYFPSLSLVYLTRF